MRPDLDAELCRKYPRLFRDRRVSMAESCFHFGFECDSGWYNLIDDLASKLEPIIERWIAVYGEENHPCVAQVKEKFAALRFYLNNPTDEMRDLVKKAEGDSVKICEVCGVGGVLMSNTRWLKTLCLLCAARLGRGFETVKPLKKDA